MPEDRAARLVGLLKEQDRTVTTAESLTGGLIAGAITAVPGSSAVFPGGIVSYCDRVKHQALGVPRELLEQYGAVSEPVAAAMVRGAAARMETDLALSATGLAGPDGDGQNPVGTVYLGLWTGREARVEKHVFPGDRAAVRAGSVRRALEMAVEYLEETGKGRDGR